MVACGIRFDAPEPEDPDVLPNGIPNYSKRPQANLGIAPPSKPQPVLFDGYDLVTGEPRQYTEREVNKMSSDEMKRALQMIVRGTLELPTIGPGPLGTGRQT